MTESKSPTAQRFEILTELGRGGMGIVYRARDRETGELVALKVLQPEIAADATILERFKNELRLARKITHKNVCRIHDLHRFGRTATIAMEYVEGDGLREILRRYSPLSVRKGLEWFGQICAGVSEAHRQGVVHRDLKPENVMLDRDGQIKVMDFGLARSVEAQASLTRGILGTPAYMSPEQAEGKVADQRADIYALGLILYEMLTGARPFHADTPVALALKHIHEEPPPPRRVEPTVPAYLEKIILRCLQKDPAKRFASISELDAAIQTPRAEAPAIAAADEPVEAPAGAAQWRRDSWLMGSALLAAIVFAALFNLVYPFRSLRIHIGPEQAGEKAMAIVRKFEPAAGSAQARPVGQWSVEEHPSNFQLAVPSAEIQQALALIVKYSPGTEWWLRTYPAKIRALGLGETIRQLPYDDYWQVRVRLEGGRPPALVRLRTDGTLSLLSIPAAPGSSAPALPSVEQAKRDAVAHVRQLFDASLNNAEPKLRSYPNALRFEWEPPGPLPDLSRNLSVTLGHAGLLRIRERFSSRHAAELDSLGRQDLLQIRASVLFAPVLLLMVLLMLGLAFFRRLYQTPRRSTVLAALCATLGLSGLWFQDLRSNSEIGGMSVLAGLLVGFLVLLFILATAEDYLWRRLRSRVATWFLLVSSPGTARSAGLAILRGCALGFIYLAAHTLILWALGAAKLAGPRTLWMEVAALSGQSYLGLYAVCWAVERSIGAAWVMMGFPAALAAGATQRPLVLIAVPAVLWTGLVWNLPGTNPTMVWVQLLLAVLQGLLMSLTLYHYDLLTLACAVFTVCNWLLVLPVWIVYSAIQPWQSLALLPWFLLVLGATVIYLRTQLRIVRQRLTAVIE